MALAGKGACARATIESALTDWRRKSAKLVASSNWIREFVELVASAGRVVQGPAHTQSIGRAIGQSGSQVAKSAQCKTRGAKFARQTGKKDPNGRTANAPFCQSIESIERIATLRTKVSDLNAISRAEQISLLWVESNFCLFNSQVARIRLAAISCLKPQKHSESSLRYSIERRAAFELV